MSDEQILQEIVKLTRKYLLNFITKEEMADEIIVLLNGNKKLLY